MTYTQYTEQRKPIFDFYFLLIIIFPLVQHLISNKELNVRVRGVTNELTEMNVRARGVASEVREMNVRARGASGELSALKSRVEKWETESKKECACECEV